MIDEIIKKYTPLGYSFLTEIDNSITCGKYELDDGCYINVEEYYTYSRQDRLFENHIKYIDFQFIIEGEEIVEIVDAYGLTPIIGYNEETDYEKFTNDSIGSKNVLKKGEGIIIYPGQAHMPCLSLDRSCYVKKAVLKIPIDRLPRLFVMDVDGTLTDGSINISENGELFKSFNVKDGYGIANILPDNGFTTAIITGRSSSIVDRRCEELGITHCIQGCTDKKGELIKLANAYGLFLNEKGILPRVAYIGDDIPDLECFMISEISGCPSDAACDIKKNADYTAKANGGAGAVREFIDWLCDETNFCFGE